MDISVALTLIQTLLQLLDSSSPLRREIESLWGYKSQLKKLENTVSIIQAVLLEAERQQRQQLQLNLPLQASLERLNEVLYDADDLFDEVATLVQHKNLISGNSVSKEVRLFFSRFNQLLYAFTKSREVKEIREKLDDIARDYSQFGSMITHQGGAGTSNSNPRETSSLLCKEDVIIGRDDDKRMVIDMLLDTAIEESVSCVSIVGIGGLGKTTLAQLVYNDESIKGKFQARTWVCVSNEFDVKSLLAVILATATNQPKQSGLSMDQLQKGIQQELDGKKYLLVLDDVWGDVTNKWQDIRKPLIGGGSRGSRILVTTRMANVTHVVGGQRHELKGLSEAESWNLFERMTLKSRHEMEGLDGEKIPEKCAAVPLAIRVIGSSLRDQGKSKWVLLAHSILANESDEDIMSVLKTSYYDLPLHLKRCFTYCAVFPKDYELIKEDLIYFWMAQGFLKANGQSLEGVGKEYFMKLLERCFFQDVKRDDNGEIISCKMHDLLHDVAESIAGNEMMYIKDNISNLNADVRHVFIGYEVEPDENKCMFCTQMQRMRTLLIYSKIAYVENVEFSKAINLRVLSWNARYPFMMEAPKMIGKLMHLRYLDFSGANFSFLPRSITSLVNLQTLKLHNCGRLKMLPNDLVKLVNLRCLDLYNCNRLKHMPPRMREMTCLQKLTRYVIGNNVGVSNSGLDDLKCLKSLSGTMQIRIQGGGTYNETEIKEGGCILELEQLKEIEIEFCSVKVYKNSEALLECLQPNHNLQTLILLYYPDVRFPSWGMRGGLLKNLKSCLPHLVEVHLSGCSKLVHLPSMRQLPKLRILHLKYLESLEYVESNTYGDEDPRQGGDELVFFPSLQILNLVDLPKLKGWGSHSNLYAFPQLNNLTINLCDKLTTIPLCLNGKAFYIVSGDIDSYVLCFYNNNEGMVEINSVNMGYIMNSLPKDILKHHPLLRIQNLDEVKRLTRELFQSKHVPCLLSLKIINCNEISKLSELGEMRGHLNSLKTLELIDLPELELEWEEEDDNGSRSSKKCKNGEGEIAEEDNDTIAFDTPWKLFSSTLRKLTLHGLPKLVKLPRGMHCLTSLHYLYIRKCNNLEELPSWIGCFTSLHSLDIDPCKKLKLLPRELCHLTSLQFLKLNETSKELYERCKKPSGDEWPNIQHIPNIVIDNQRVQGKYL